MKDLGEPMSFFGMTIKINKAERYMVTHKSTYMKSILEQFAQVTCASPNTAITKQRINCMCTRNLFAPMNSAIATRLKIQALCASAHSFASVPKNWFAFTNYKFNCNFTLRRVCRSDNHLKGRCNMQCISLFLLDNIS